MLRKLFKEGNYSEKETIQRIALQFLNYHCTVLRGASSANKVGERTLTARKCFDAVVLSQVFFWTNLLCFSNKNRACQPYVHTAPFMLVFLKPAKKEDMLVCRISVLLLWQEWLAAQKQSEKEANNHQKVPKLCKNLSESAKIAVSVTFKSWIVVDGSLVNCQLLMGIRSKFYKDNRVLRVHPHLKCQAHRHQNQI